MSPITHLLAGWTAANVVRLDRRDRILIALAGVIPDADGLGILVDLVRRSSVHPYEFYQRFHHVLCHNLFFGIGISVAAYFSALRKRMTAALVFLEVQAEVRSEPAGLQYRLAVCYAGSGDKKKAVDALKRAAAGGFGDAARIDAEPAFAKLREDVRFKQIVDEIKARPAA